MGKEISEAELAALSGITGIDKSIISKIRHFQILDTAACKKILIREEYLRYAGNGNIREKGILQLLSEKYHVSRSLVEQVVYNKDTNKQMYCKCCGTQVSKYKYKKNKGFCDICKSK
ncbi:hypothetical protein IR083_07935 [Dysgonomonas sp. GY75]|uniref:hypothetical protein n=1 Tax=Dysgonomonas sp. GY75 TaxID=2780419 RepID=UPI0018846D0F|nr:hypothetical protein [Dysgonomonas sp. GY75]MBF0648747.1 hypothetical protein [Dysgonomonas sp. GY75]